MNRHNLIQPKAWLTSEAWQQIEPMLDSMPADGGCLAIVIDARPDMRNFLTGSVSVFDDKERQIIRRAIRRRRDAAKEAKG